jgi:predicted transcriptional regulator of viral defense system
MLKTDLRRVEYRTLIDFAVRGSKPSTCQRIGLLLERSKISLSALRKLRSKARQKSSLLSMDPDAPRTGAVNRTWNVVENDI